MQPATSGVQEPASEVTPLVEKQALQQEGVGEAEGVVLVLVLGVGVTG